MVKPSPASVLLLEVGGVLDVVPAGVEALVDAYLEVGRHEVVALVGDNAAGKSTLARIVSGAFAPTSGTVEFDGVAVEIPSPREAFKLGIATVFQELALCENLDVTANVFLGRELRGPGHLLDHKEMERLGGKIMPLMMP